MVRKITEHYRGRFDIVDTDGVRVILPDGWGLVRASNTQPILVLRFEADSAEAGRRIEAMVRADLAGLCRSLSVRSTVLAKPYMQETKAERSGRPTGIP